MHVISDLDYSSIYEVPINTVDGSTTNLETYRGCKLLIVNVASRCFFTRQYSLLEEFHRKYVSQGVHILGFPCNQFLHQEPQDNKQINEFTQTCYKITFPLFAKIEVKGKKQAPLYAYLQNHIKKKPFVFIPWNFTKILVDAQGAVLKQYWPTVPFEKIKQELDVLI